MDGVCCRKLLCKVVRRAGESERQQTRLVADALAAVERAPSGPSATTDAGQQDLVFVTAGRRPPSLSARCKPGKPRKPPRPKRRVHDAAAADDDPTSFLKTQGACGTRACHDAPRRGASAVGVPRTCSHARAMCRRPGPRAAGCAPKGGGGPDGGGVPRVDREARSLGCLPEAARRAPLGRVVRPRRHGRCLLGLVSAPEARPRAMPALARSDADAETNTPPTPLPSSPTETLVFHADLTPSRPNPTQRLHGPSL